MPLSHPSELSSFPLPVKLPIMHFQTFVLTTGLFAGLALSTSLKLVAWEDKKCYIWAQDVAGCTGWSDVYGPALGPDYKTCSMSIPRSSFPQESRTYPNEPLSDHINLSTCRKRGWVAGHLRHHRAGRGTRRIGPRWRRHQASFVLESRRIGQMADGL